MDKIKSQVIDELIDHLRSIQGEDFKSEYDESMKPDITIEEVDVSPESTDEMDNMKIDETREQDVTPETPLMPGEEEMTDEELEEMLRGLA